MKVLTFALIPATPAFALRFTIPPRQIPGPGADPWTLPPRGDLLQDPQNLPKVPTAFFGFETGGRLEVSLSAQPIEATTTSRTPGFLRIPPAPLSGWDLARHRLLVALSLLGSPKVATLGQGLEGGKYDVSDMPCPNPSDAMRNGEILEAGYLGQPAMNPEHPWRGVQHLDDLGDAKREIVLRVSSAAEEEEGSPSTPGTSRNRSNASSVPNVNACTVPMGTSQLPHGSRRLAPRPSSADEQINGAFLFLMDETQRENARRVLLPRLRLDPFHHYALNTFLPSALRIPLTKDTTFTHDIIVPGRYFLFIMGPDANPYILSGMIQLTNPGGNHLSTTQYYEGDVATAMGIVYGTVALCLGALRLGMRGLQWNARHSLLLAVFTLKASYLLLDGWNCATFAAEGELGTVRIILPKVIAKIEDIAALMLFFLLSLGWKMFRRNLTRLETRVAVGLALMSFYLALFEIVMGGFQLSRYILHAFAFLCIIVAINFNVALLSSRVTQMDLTLACSVCYAHVEAYKSFRWIFVFFIMKPSALLFFKLSILHYDSNDWDNWLIIFLENCFDLIIYVAVLKAFAPTEGIPLVKHVSQLQDSNTSNDDNDFESDFEEAVPVDVEPEESVN